MKKLFKISLIVYTVFIGVLIPFSLLVKGLSHSSGYYSTSFILLLTFLIITFVSSIVLHSIRNRASRVKRTVKYILIALVLTGLVYQVIWSFELFEEKISSTADAVVGGVYIFLGLMGIGSLSGLLMTFRN